ncbi:MAG: hypothetical protein OEW18_01225 [Candidatus Aminicenantes bacterium]|nr:hypothetical protein [Candidatus Aminicenantes bacterium]
MRDGKRTLLLTFLLGFVFISLCINFLHTEKTVKNDYACPACHFLTSALTTGQILFFSIPRLLLLATIVSRDFLYIKEVFTLSPLSRSPPQA